MSIQGRKATASAKACCATTMYQDCAINPELFHWESQSATRAGSPTGQRYIHHHERGSHVLLFAR